MGTCGEQGRCVTCGEQDLAVVEEEDERRRHQQQRRQRQQVVCAL